ncbi:MULTISPECIES: AraC family transcriptional regulator [unclassified Serratia (in: enterobacteria)]|uniref:helix-turn-helix transcriptional regulator n=1 Tax=unclassified Serratia (in: enterobacteria) TaxID=2647522 RepID=UPI00046883E2|nr:MULTISPECIES: AraC family transcriptional regulator [unclassified Serratia (in: enterobacteria)]
MPSEEQRFFSELLSGLALNAQEIKPGHFGCQTVPAPQGEATIAFPRLLVVLRGEYPIWGEGERPVTLEHGDTLWLPAHSWHQPCWGKDVLLLSILFAPAWLGFQLIDHRVAKAGPQRLRQIEVPQQNAGELEHIIQALNYLSARAHEPQIGRHLILSLLFVCRAQIATPLADKVTRSQFLYKSICMYIQDNYANDLTRDRITALFKISPNHLSRIFREEGTMNFVSYLRWVRLGKAKMILQKYHLHINEIALRCGFRDSDYFCRQFKQQFGMTPSEYRDRFL